MAPADASAALSPGSGGLVGAAASSALDSLIGPATSVRAPTSPLVSDVIYKEDLSTSPRPSSRTVSPTDASCPRSTSPRPSSRSISPANPSRTRSTSPRPSSRSISPANPSRTSSPHRTSFPGSAPRTAPRSAPNKSPRRASFPGSAPRSAPIPPNDNSSKRRAPSPRRRSGRPDPAWKVDMRRAAFKRVQFESFLTESLED